MSDAGTSQPHHRVVLAGGSELDATTPAGQALAGCRRVAVVTLAAAFRRPDALVAAIDAWAAQLGIQRTVIRAVRRADSLNPEVSAPIADVDAVLVLDGSPAHFVGAMKATPLLEAVVTAHQRGAHVVWSGAAASAVCAAMVDDRGGALTVGLRLIDGVVVATGWERWPRDRRRRLERMVAGSQLFLALESGAAVQASASPDELRASCSPDAWTTLGGVVTARRRGAEISLAQP